MDVEIASIAPSGAGAASNESIACVVMQSASCFVHHKPYCMPCRQKESESENERERERARARACKQGRARASERARERESERARAPLQLHFLRCQEHGTCVVQSRLSTHKNVSRISAHSLLTINLKSVIETKLNA
jgi:hypothetical protein